MPVVHIEHLDDPRVDGYRNVPDPVLLRERGVFVAEGRLVVEALLQSPSFRADSVLVSPAAFEAMQVQLAPWPDLPVFVGPLDVLEGIVGFNIHRGCLALGRRPAPLSVRDVVARAATPLVVVAERVGNADNIGALFRNARAFGAGAVILGPGCCDPLYRKAIRVSIGACLRVPFAVANEWPGALGVLQEAGYEVVALTPHADDDLATYAGQRAARVAVLVGHEGEGLSDTALSRAERRVRIDMVAGSDSVNVATAAAIAMYACGSARR